MLAAGLESYERQAHKTAFARFALDIIAKTGDDVRVRYPGGKGKCYQKVINLMPPHTTYIEAFLGGGSVLRYKAPALINIGIDIDARVIQNWKWSESHALELIHGDAIEYLSRYSYSGSELIYCDPPYLPCARRRQRVYRHDLAEGDHIRLLILLRSLPCKVLVSGYPSMLYDELLASWNCISFSAKTHYGNATERLWFNYPVPKHLHDSRYIGTNFREREAANRRLARLQSRLSRLPITELHRLREWLDLHITEEE